MSGRRWGGRKVARLTAACLTLRGTVCHLCGLEGANSPDHDPPRSELLRLGVPDPDALVYLWPSHRLCNFVRHDRPITPDLKAECRRKYLASLGRGEAPAPLSPRFAARRPTFEAGSFESRSTRRNASLPVSPRATPEKTAATTARGER